MESYSSARDAYEGTQGTFLDANESPYGLLNRYPDPYQKLLKQKLSEVKSVAIENIFVGNGSDEVIDLLMRIFCRPSKDKVIGFTPSYGMYQVSASIQDVEYISIPLNERFQIDAERVKSHLTDERVKIIFVCSPNNPTGNLINVNDIEWLLKKFNGLVVIDEAYIDFANTSSWLSKIMKYNKLVILQTLSKAWGLAAVRIGMAYTNTEIIALLNKVKSPYNISSLNQKVALEALQNKRSTDTQIHAIKKERSRLRYELSRIKGITKIHPSETNFLLIEIDNADEVYRNLISHNIITRNQTNKLENGIRISIGTSEENKRLLKALKGNNNLLHSTSKYDSFPTNDLINRH